MFWAVNIDILHKTESGTEMVVFFLFFKVKDFAQPVSVHCSFSINDPPLSEPQGSEKLKWHKYTSERAWNGAMIIPNNDSGNFTEFCIRIRASLEYNLNQTIITEGKQTAWLISEPRWSLTSLVILPNYSSRKEKEHGSEEERKSLHHV